MLGFKQYAVLTCQVAFEERSRSHFLKYIGPDLFLYLQDKDFLLDMTSKDGVKTTGIQFYVNEIDKAGSIYNELYNKFIGPLGLGDKIKYYRVAAYYLKKLGLTLKEENLFIDKEKRANNAIKEIFAENLYDYMIHLNGAQTEKEDLAVGGVKNAIKKTFVPDSFFTSAHQNDSTADRSTTGLTSLLEWNDPKLFPSVERPTNKNVYERQRSPLAKSILYTNNTFTFDGEIFSIDKDKENFERTYPHLTGLNQIPKFKDTLKSEKFTDILSNGVYVEFFFKYDIQELINNLVSVADSNSQSISGEDTAKQLLFWLQQFSQDPLNPYYKTQSSFRPTIPADVSAGGKDGVGKYEATQYHSLRSFALLLGTLYKYSRESAGVFLQTKSAKQVSSALPSIADIDQAIKNTKIEFGARLVISTPALDVQTNSDLIRPWPYGNFSAASNIKIYNSQFDEKEYAAPNGGVVINAFDDLINDSELYSKDNLFASGFKNKTFVYNLVDISFKEESYEAVTGNMFGPKTQTTVATLNNFTIATAYCFPIAEERRTLTGADKQRFIKDFYFDILRYTTDTEIKNATGYYWKLRYMDYSIEQAVVKKYYQSVLDNLFEKDLIKKFFESQLIGKRYLQVLNPNSYQGLVTNSAEDISFFKDDTAQRTALIEECNKTDDKTDQNLITLIESIEEV
tara:strand:+ start:6061 stop:8106 length:2046 start_codon:yes stop_codon:yes gene_type:complete